MTKNRFLSKRLACLCTTALIALPIYSLNNNSAKAQITLTNNGAWLSVATGADDAAKAASGENIAIGAFTLSIPIADGQTLDMTVGAITGTATTAIPTINIDLSEDARVDQTVTIGSIAITGSATDAGLLDIDFLGANVESGVVTITGNADLGTETGGLLGNITLNVADTDTANQTAVLNLGGNVTGNTTFDQGATAQTVTININGSGNQTYTGTINSAGGAGEGTLNITKTGGTATFANAIGTAENGSLLRINTTTAASTSVFNGAVAATNIGNSGTSTFGSTVTTTTATLATGSTTTFTGKVTATTLAANGTAAVKVGFGNADVDETNVVATVDLNNTASLIIEDTVTNGMKVFKTTNLDAANVADGTKIYMPINLTNSQTLVLFGDTDNGGDVDNAVNAALQNNALMTYASVEATEVVTVTATATTEAARATSLGVSSNMAKAVSQAYLASINDTVADATAEDAFNNAFNALGGMTATTDTDLTKQVSPQTDTITGSTIAAKAVTSGVQNVIATRLASLRSGDAYSTGIVTGSHMGVNSGFVQAFGSTVDQKNKGNEFGYDADTTGFAIGFDTKVPGGAVIGISYARSEADVDGKGTGRAKNDITTDSVSLYADYATKDGYVEGSITYGKSDNKGSRIVNTAGLNRTYNSNYDGEQYSFRLSGGIPQSLGGGAFFTPFAAATISQIKADAYTETSTTTDDALRLRVAQDTVDSQVGTVGVKFHQAIKDGKTTFTPEVKLAINQEFGDGNITTTNTYQGGGASFKNSTAIEKTSATAGLGLNISSDNVSFNIGYEADVKDKYLGHSAQAKITAKF